MTRTALEKYWKAMEVRHAKEKADCLANAQRIEAEKSSDEFQGVLRHLNDPAIIEADDLALAVKDTIVVVKHLLKRVEELENALGI